MREGRRVEGETGHRAALKRKRQRSSSEEGAEDRTHGRRGSQGGSADPQEKAERAHGRNPRERLVGERERREKDDDRKECRAHLSRLRGRDGKRQDGEGSAEDRASGRRSFELPGHGERSGRRRDGRDPCAETRGLRERPEERADGDEERASARTADRRRGERRSGGPRSDRDGHERGRRQRIERAPCSGPAEPEGSHHRFVVGRVRDIERAGSGEASRQKNGDHEEGAIDRRGARVFHRPRVPG